LEFEGGGTGPDDDVLRAVQRQCGPGNHMPGSEMELRGHEGHDVPLRQSLEVSGEDDQDDNQRAHASRPRDRERLQASFKTAMEPKGQARGSAAQLSMRVILGLREVGERSATAIFEIGHRSTSATLYCQYRAADPRGLWSGWKAERFTNNRDAKHKLLQYK